MTTLYVTTEGALVRATDERLTITKGHEKLAEMPLHKLDAVVVFDAASVTPAAMRILAERRIDLCFTDYNGRYFGRLQPVDSPHVRLRKRQYLAQDDPLLRLKLARGFVLGKLYNQRSVLLRARRAENVSEQREKRITEAIEQLRHASRQAKMAESLDSLRGCEGSGAAAYFQVFEELLLTQAFSFRTRTRNPPTDPVNAMLSFGYSMLAKDAIAAASLVGLDPYAGYLHGDRYNQPSLGLDLMEEFRPLIVDATVLALINRKQVTPEGFQTQISRAVVMDTETRKIFLRGYEERKRTELRHPHLQQTTTYIRSLELQARIVVKVLLGELDEYVPFIAK
ncbi:MAG: CRISPR-associated endonuclease Cas1 [Acidobacteria bacterium]|nr:CRISPR-associated endonuclease Cas1 [Acidobacteriota bacterium]